MSKPGTITHTPKKSLLTTPNPYEQKFGYHRAVRRGPFLAVSGTTALKLTDPESNPKTSSLDEALSSKVHFHGNAHKQTIYVLNTCLDAVSRLGGKKQDVVRVRMFVGDARDCGDVGEGFKEVFGTQKSGDGEDEVGVAATMIVVPGGFVDGEILVEVEVEAFVV